MPHASGCVGFAAGVLPGRHRIFFNTQRLVVKSRSRCQGPTPVHSMFQMRSTLCPVSRDCAGGRAGFLFGPVTWPQRPKT